MIKRSAPTVWFLSLAALAVFGGGCRPNMASVEPHSICSMPDDCKFSSACSEQTLANPVLDLSGGVAMWLAVEMHNQLSNNADKDSGQANTHDAHFESYSLEYSSIIPGIDPAMITDLPSSGGLAQQVIPAAGTAVIGFEPFPIGVVNAINVAGGAPGYPDYDEVKVKVKLKGRFDDGSKWEVPYEIPVRLCEACIPIVCTDPSQMPISACPTFFQEPRGALNCTKSPATCVTTGSFCGSNPNVTGGDASTLYVCTTAGSAPASQSVCPLGCDDSTPPNDKCN